MKIAYTGFELPEGKVKYNDAILADLEGKFKPDKVSPYYVELLPEGFESAEGIAPHTPPKPTKQSARVSSPPLYHHHRLGQELGGKVLLLKILRN